ncbi:MAG: hypothetical protein Q7T18_01970, partial [Sedimentisphaerales bacterium]|nr:hypothetical protein [Sedimentisphaerales bacterium]
CVRRSNNANLRSSEVYFSYHDAKIRISCISKILTPKCLFFLTRLGTYWWCDGVILAACQPDKP